MAAFIYRFYLLLVKLLVTSLLVHLTQCNLGLTLNMTSTLRLTSDVLVADSCSETHALKCEFIFVVRQNIVCETANGIKKANSS